MMDGEPLVWRQAKSLASKSHGIKRRNGGKSFPPFLLSHAGLGFLNYQVIVHGEDSGHAIRANPRSIFIGLVIDHAFQGYVPAFDDNVDWRQRSHGITGQAIIIED